MRKNKILIIVIGALVVAIVFLSYYLYNKNKQYQILKENDYNMAFYEVVDYVQNVKTYLAKTMVSKSSKHGAENLTHVWKEANLAQSYVGMLPIESQELENTGKFLNQVSEYSYYLSRKNIDGEGLTDEELDKIKELYNYSNDLSNTLNEISTELNNGTLKWADLMKNTEGSDITEVSSFNVVEQNFHEYSGLIYDGAFSEHITSSEKKGLTGQDIDEETAKQKVQEFIGKDNIKEIKSNGFVENGDIAVYRFEMVTNENQTIGISISKKGGHVVYINYNRDVKEEKISPEDAIERGKKYLQQKGFENMQQTYYLKEDGFITVNYAYVQQNVIMYPDLIKVKIALDNGEIIGLESTGYLNCHYERKIPENKISIEEARKSLTNKIQITSEKLAVIPTEWNTEVFCYEFKGDILIITNTPNGILTE